MTRQRVIIVEDEPLIAFELSETVTDGGFECVGTATTVPEALLLLQKQDCDIVVLDAFLNNVNSSPVASMVEQLGVPYVVVSGYSADQLPMDMQAAPLLVKPFLPELLVATLNRLIGR